MRKIAGVVSMAMAAWMLSTAAAPPEDATQRAVRRGNDLYAYDRSAWVSSDAMLASLPADRLPELSGWVSQPFENGYRVQYFGGKSGSYRTVFTAVVKDEKVTASTVYPFAAKPPMSAAASAMADALATARTELARHPDWQPCAAAPFNTVVLPSENGVVPVYFLTPQTTAGEFPLGGHYEIDVDAKGQVISARPFSKACIPLKQQSKRAKGTPVGLFLTHLLDLQPTEIHVFEQHYIGLPLFVGTSSGTWKVKDGQVARMK